MDGRTDGQTDGQSVELTGHLRDPLTEQKDVGLPDQLRVSGRVFASESSWWGFLTDRLRVCDRPVGRCLTGPIKCGADRDV